MLLYFCKNTPKFFQNYILVPAILYLGPYLTFYNYNSVLFLINMLILITYLNLLTSNPHNILTVAPI
jgi:hypothetical protein